MSVSQGTPRAVGDSPGPGREAGKILPQIPRGSRALPAPPFQTSSLQNCETMYFCGFQPLSLQCGTWLPQPQKTNTLFKLRFWELSPLTPILCRIHLR